MALRVVSAAFLAAGVIACTPVPKYQTDGRIKPTDVARRAYCELILARKDPKIATLNLDKYAVAIALGLKVESNVNPNIRADWVIPYHLTDTFTSAATAGVDDYVMRDSSVKYKIRLRDLERYSCPDDFATAYADDKANAQMSYGSFGLLNWLEQTAHNANSSSITPSLDYYSVKFAVTGNANPGPGFKIINLSGTMNLGLKRIDTNSLNVAFVSADPSPQEVCVVNLPGSCAEKPAPTSRPAAKTETDTAKPKRGTAAQTGRRLKLDGENAPIRPSQLPPAIDQQLDRKIENLQLRDIIRQ